jgi:hypothetical protein
MGAIFFFRVRELGQLMGPKTSLFSPEKNKKNDKLKINHI